MKVRTTTNMVNLHAQALGRLSASKMTPEQRRERAKKAGLASKINQKRFGWNFHKHLKKNQTIQLNEISQ